MGGEFRASLDCRHTVRRATTVGMHRSDCPREMPGELLDCARRSAGPEPEAAALHRHRDVMMRMMRVNAYSSARATCLQTCFQVSSYSRKGRKGRKGPPSLGGRPSSMTDLHPGLSHPPRSRAAPPPSSFVNPPPPFSRGRRPVSLDRRRARRPATAVRRRGAEGVGLGPDQVQLRVGQRQEQQPRRGRRGGRPPHGYERTPHSRPDPAFRTPIRS